MVVLIPTSLILVLALPLVVATLELSAWATTDHESPQLKEGKVSISEDFGGFRIQDKDSLNATDYYFIQAKYGNPSEETIYLSKVSDVVSVLDQYGIAHYVDANTYGDQILEGGGISDYSVIWFPQVPGPYTVKTFLVSDWDNPQVISTLTTFHVKVNEKIDMLEEGGSNSRLEVESINTADVTVKIVFNYCDENPPYSHRGGPTSDLETMFLSTLSMRTLWA